MAHTSLPGRADWSRRSFLATVGAAALGLTACGGAGGQESAAVDISGVQAPALDGLTGDERTRVATLIAKARSEGALNWITPIITESKDPLIDAFKTRYNLPALQVTFENLQTAQVTSRVQSEVTSRQIKTDVVGLNGSPSFFKTLKDAGMLENYQSPELKAYQGTEKYVSFDPGYWASPIAVQYLPVYNPKVWTTGVSSWYDLLDPRLKGKLSWPGVPSSESALLMYRGLREVLPLSFFQSLKGNAPRVGVGNSTVATQMVSQGELTIAVTQSHTVHNTAQQLGIPLEVGFPKEGAVLDGWSVGILTGCPHPSAAKLFMDFILSQAAVQTMVEKQAATPVREDVKMPADLAHFAPASPAAAHAIVLDQLADRKTMQASRDEFVGVFGG
ncbi:extracellular solute-binding protein [Amycolatopsis acidicola]|uniref:Extracellular solute-binding protein n=1 Tax=Amycolatopsis acidicola TaxID=2596893 RepID=A0A5N0V2M9_9PSEU|nr:extracellular solute-binding protein [Amycolatopsis acidicola]KAA9160074.1 extracellular solute-binding protein [Amycolatopsis acidicola]